MSRPLRLRLNAVNLMNCVHELMGVHTLGTAERREREREQVRTLILEAARDILSEQGFAALSMRAIAERIEYSPATIYLYFKDKDDLIREVVEAGFERLEAALRDLLSTLPETMSAADQYGATGRAYARFALENTAYFRVMFELPGVAHLIECPRPEGGAPRGDVFDDIIALVARAGEEGSFAIDDAGRAAVIGWGLIHGLVTLYLGGHLASDVGSHDEFLELVEDAVRVVHTGWGGAGNPQPATPQPATRKPATRKPATQTQRGGAGNPQPVNPQPATQTQ